MREWPKSLVGILGERNFRIAQQPYRDIQLVKYL